MKPIVLSEHLWLVTKPTSTSIYKKRLKTEWFRCNRTSTPPTNHRILEMVQKHTSKLHTLLPWREGICHHIRWVFICINISCPPFILHTSFSDKMKCNRVGLLLQERVGHCSVCKHQMIVPINVGRLREWDAHHYKFKSQSPDIFRRHLHCTKITTKRWCFNGIFLLWHPIN